MDYEVEGNITATKSTNAKHCTKPQAKNLLRTLPLWVHMCLEAARFKGVTIVP